MPWFAFTYFSMNFEVLDTAWFVGQRDELLTPFSQDKCLVNEEVELLPRNSDVA